jgi:hypothetical protein
MTGLSGLIILVITVLVLIAPFATIGATVFLWNLYRSDPVRPRSRILLMLSTGSTLILIATMPLAFLAYRRIINAPPLPADIVVLLLAIPVLAMEFIPTYFAISIIGLQRKVRGQ